MPDDSNFKYIIRIANSDVSGEERLANALTSIRGVGPRISNAIVQKLKLDPNKLAGKLDDKNVDDIEKAIMNLNSMSLTGYLIGRRTTTRGMIYIMLVLTLK